MYTEKYRQAYYINYIEHGWTYSQPTFVVTVMGLGAGAEKWDCERA
jgi:bacteriorhodopsin